MSKSRVSNTSTAFLENNPVANSTPFPWEVLSRTLAFQSLPPETKQAVEQKHFSLFGKEEAGQQFSLRGLPPLLGESMVKRESSGNPIALSKSDAFGLMQLTPDAATDVKVDRTVPSQNVRGGAELMRQHLDTFGDLPKAIAAYHAGPGRVRTAIDAGGDQWLSHLGPQTRDYVSNIMSDLEPGRQAGPLSSRQAAERVSARLRKTLPPVPPISPIPWGTLTQAKAFQSLTPADQQKAYEKHLKLLPDDVTAQMGPVQPPSLPPSISDRLSGSLPGALIQQQVLGEAPPPAIAGPPLRTRTTGRMPYGHPLLRVENRERALPPGMVGPPRPEISRGLLADIATAGPRALTGLAKTLGNAGQAAADLLLSASTPEALEARGAGGALEIPQTAPRTPAEAQSRIKGEERVSAAMKQPIENVLQEVESFERDNPGMFTPSKEEGEGWVRKALVRGPESAIQSLAISIPAFLAGGLPGLILSGGTLFSMAEFQQAGKDIEKYNSSALPEKQIPPHIATQIKIIRAVAEGGGEMVSDFIGGKILGLDTFFKGAGKEALQSVLTPSLRKTLGQVSGVAVSETLSEMGTAAAQVAANRLGGIPGPSPLEAAIEAGPQALVASLIFSSVGLGAQRPYMQKTAEALSKADVSPDLRMKAASDISEAIREETKDETLARNFQEAATASIQRGEPIPLDLTAQGVATAGQQQQRSELLTALRERVSRSPVATPTAQPPPVEAKLTTDDIHLLADSRKIAWDNNQDFLVWSEALTGEPHLDRMTPQQLRVVAEAIVRGARPTLQTTPAAPPPDIAAAEVPLGAPAPATPQPTPGTVRFYHGGVPGEGARWLSPDYDYAAEYARKAGQEGASVQYVDIPEGSPLLQKAFDDEGATVKAPHVSFEAPAEVMAQAKPFFLPAPETPAAATIPEPGEAQRLEAPPPVLGQAARLPLLPPGVEQGVMTVSVEPPILGQGATISAAPPILGQAQNPPVETIAALRAPEFRPPPVREEETPLAIASRFANTEESGPVLPPSPAAEEPERVLPPLPLSGSPAAQNIPTPKPSAGPPNRVEQALEAIATGAATFTKAAKQTVRKAVGKVVDGKPVETLSDQALAQAYLAKIQEGEPQALPQTPPLARAIPPVAPDISAPTYGATNKLVSRERAEEVRKRLRDKLNQLNVGIDPEMLSLGAELAVFHLEAGAHSFAQFVKSITQDVGEKARPYLKSWYLAARNWPGMDKSGMQTEQELDAISDEEIDNTIEEQNRAAIDSIRQASEETLAGEPPQDVPGIREERTTPPVPPQRPGIDEESLRGVSIPGSEPASSMGAGTGGVAPSLERGTGPRPRGESPHVDSPGRGRDYIITDTDQIGAGGPKAKYANNVAAIRTLKQILSEGRTATQEEQAVLVKYTGWGALPQVFAQYGDPRLARDEWRNERKELQELLSPSAYQSARASTENAHYTSAPVIREIYRALEHLGFTGGRLLEPSMGVGHFFGLMPPSLASHTARTGIELDKITGEIAKQIYQGSDVRIGGFQDAKIPNGFYDVAVSNVPFGVGIADKNYPPFITKGIHNYFFARALDKVRPGGVVAFITSRYTLDGVDTQVRAYLAERADFLGAVRLPNTAFKDTAGTSVTTDLIFLRKREEGKERSGETWEKTETIADRTSGSLITINEYFVTHPHMLLGEMELAGTMYRGGEPTLTAPQGQNLPQAMREALASLPQNAITPAAAVAQKSRVSYAQDLDPGKTKQNAYFLKGKSLYQNTVSGVIPVSTTDSGALARIKGMVGLRDTVRELLQSQLTDAPDAEISQIQERLGTQYAAFVKAHGLLHDRANVRSFVEDPDLPLLLSLENYDTETKSATRADIFTKRTISPKKTISHAETAKDALLVSLDETGGIDFDRMAQLTGGSLADLREELRGIVFENPEGGWETADAYLSGNVKHKLSVAEGAARADVKYQENVDALIVVQPEDITPSQIDVHLGASWVPTGDLQDFLRYILNVENVPTVRHVPVTASWVIDKPSTYLASSARNVETWGTSRYGAVDLIEDAMNQRLPTVRDQTEDGTSVINQAKTLAAREKQEALKNEFKTWIWADEERATRLSRIYNDTYNNTRLREYNGDHLTFPGMTPLVTLRPHQTGAVWRILQSGNTLLAHVVGGGKTITGIAAAMELRRMGIAKKPMFVVPKHLTEQWAIEFRRLYPAANILLTQKEDFTAANRKRLMSRIATGDWDAVIVAHSSFTRLPVGDDLFNEFLHKEINQLGDAILEAKEARLGTRVIKEIEKAKKRLEKKLREKKEELAQDAVVSFEETGVDFLFVDESDAFKNLFTPTKMTRVSGLPAAESNRSFDLFVKTQYLRRLTNGRGVVFATGTPVSNSMAEVFTMQRYLQPQVLEESGLTNFDAWAQNFGEAVTTIEMKPDGSGYRPRTRFAKFVNVPELIQMFRQVMDVKTAEDLNLPVPKLRGGKPDVHVSPATETLLEFISSLASRASAVQGGHVDSRDDNMLKITSEGRKAALDIRLVLPQAQEDRNGKLNVAAKQIDSLYKETAEGKGVQLVFLDMSTPKAKGAAKKATTPTPSEEDGVESGDVETAEEVTLRDSLYVELQNKLVKSGIKGEEIAFIHQADTDAKKTKLFADANSGKVRVLIGSTEKMGAGTNVQRKLVALHHLDAPWRPRDVEQRNGRILRQGNEFFGKDPNFTVGIHHYVTEKSFDVYMWQTLEAKARMIAQAMSGDLTTRSIEDADKDALTASEIKAIASGNPLVMEKVKVDTEVRKLGMLRSQYKEGQAKAARELTLIPQRIAAAETQVAEIEEAIRLRDTSEKTEKPTAVILGETVVGREDINQALERASSTVSMEEPSVMGNYRGVEIRIRPMLGGGSKSYLQLPNGYSLDVGTLSVGGLNAALSSLDPRLARVEARVANDQKQQKEYASLLGNPFPQEDRLLELTEKQKEIDKELGVDGGDTIREEEDPQPQSLTGERRFIAEEVRKRLGDKLINQLNVGIDPEMLSLGAELAVFHLEAGAHSFAQFVKSITQDVGEKARPYLKSWYLAARNWPGMDKSGMQTEQELDAISDEEIDNTIEEQNRAAIDSIRQASEETLAGEPPQDVPGIREERTTPPVPPQRPGIDEESLRGVSIPGSEPASSMGAGTGGVAPSLERGTGPRPRGESPHVDSPGRGRDYIITDTDQIGAGGPKAKYANNVAAIRTLKQILSEGRTATQEEQAVLVKYTGWGALPQVFAQYGDPRLARDEWRNERKELQELLSPSAYQSARASTENAHYTSAPVIREIYRALEHLGFTGGRLLEPSMGVGHFFGLMPPSLASHTARTGIELDKITGEIAKQIYQGSDVRIGGFQDAKIPNGFYDVAVSNVPFGVGIADKNYPPFITKGIHNYFFARALDKVRPGGVVAFITSRYTLDGVDTQVRAYLAERADFLGAVRLPNTAFKDTAGTSVTTDLIFLRKREEGKERSGETWEKTETIADRTSGSLITINEYFVTHPHMLLGEMELAGTMYRGGEPTLTAPQGQNLPQAMREALASLPQNAITPAAAVAQKSRVSYAQDLDPGKTKQNAYFLKGKSLYQNTVSGVIPVSTTDSGALARIKGMVGLRDTVRELLQSQLTDAPDAEISQIQERLGTQYAAFVKAHGLLHDRANVRSFVEDPDLPLLLSLENYDTETKSATRADIFTKRTISPKKTISHAETAKDALLVSLDETGGIDFDRMAQLTGGSLADLREELRGIVFENPEGGWETADAYLSGNVKHKLSVAEGAARADVKYQENVDALIVVQPEDITPSQIDVHLGASWVPTGDLQDFLRYILNVENVPTVRHVPVTASWVIDKPSTYLASSARNVETWGTSRYGAVDLIEDAMNQRLPTVRDQTEDGTSVINQAKTLAAREKQEALKNEFKTWIWADEERATRLSRIYNDTYNNTRLREYNGDHLTFPGMTPLVTLRPHQTGAVWRILQSGNTLLAHVVGGGKTITGIAAAMELRRMGIAKKPMFVVPKHLTEQWAIEFRRLYPAANILLTQKEDFTAANRKRLMSRIATGDWDAVIVAHSSFTRLPVGDDLFNEFLHKEINQLGDAILEAKEARLGTRVIKEIEKAKKRLEKKLREKKEELAQDAVVSFEETGVDFLFVDESDAFKNLFTPTKMTRVSGLPAAESNRSFDLFVKTQYLRRLTNGRGVVFATGTPVSNSMAEVFTMQRYLQPQVLEESGLTNFDAWAQNFGEAVTTIEMKPDGSGYRPRTRFAKFVNVPELIQMFRQVMDVKTAEDLNLPVPKLRGGKPDVHVSPATETLLEFISSLASRASAVQGGHVDSRDDNMLKITSEGRKAALDIRLVLPQAQEDRNGKLNVAAKQIDSLYKETAEGKGVQLVFLDMSTPKAKGAAKKATTPTPSEEDGVESGDVETAEEVTLRDSLYVELQNKLVKSGIKGEEIAFIHQADTDAKKTKLFADANSGKVRVLIGSTEKMGAGTNVQRKLVALHHLDAPWRPRDVEQRNGRILRQGNEFFGKDPNFTVGIHHYVTEKSFDVYMWQTLEAKARMIAQAMSGDLTTRSIEDADKDALTASEIKAIASGNPLVMEKVKVDTEVRKLGMLRSQYKEGQAKAARELTLIPQRIAAAETQVAEIEEAIRLRDTSEKTEKPTAVILGETVVGREDINQALERASSTVSMEEPSVMGNYRGVEIRIRPMLGGGSKSYLQLPNGYSLDVGTLSVGGLNAALSSLDPRLARVEARVANDQKQQKEYASLLGNPFPQEDRLLELTEKQKEIDKELGVDGGDTIREEEDPQPQSLTGERRFIAEEVRKRLGDKLINQLNVGIDPEMLSLEIAGIGQFARKYAGHRAIELETMLGEGRGEKVLSEEQWTQARISTQEADVIETMGQLLTHEGMWRILTRTFGKRYASEISKFFRSFDTTAKRFGVPASRQDALFDSAESIKTFQNGQPVFGSRIFEKDPDTKELMRDQYGLPIMKEWRYTPEQGEEFWDALSDQEKAAVRYWVDMRDIVKEVFNVSGEIEGYMHHFWTNGFFEGLGVLAGRHTRLRKKLAGSRIARQAEEGKGFSHDFERSVVKVWHDLIKEDEWNKMMTRLVPLVTDPIGPDGIRQGWVEIPKNVLTRRGKFIGQIAGGRQIPEELYKEMVAWMEPVKSTSAVADASRSIGSYITANLLLYPGTFANNIVGSGVQYATLVADTAAKAMLTGQVRPFLDVATAPFRALLPSVGQVYSPELLGAHSNLITQFRDRNAVDAAFSGVLSLTMGAVDNYVKRATALAVSQQLGIPKSATQAQVLEMKEAYAEMRKFVDTFGLDYSNVNSRMGKFREYSGSRLISPFVTYGYKIMQMMGHYLAALNPGARMDPDSRFQFDRGGLAKVGLSPEHIERIARLMVLGTIFTLLSSVFPEEEEETGKHLPGMPWSLDRTGMVKLSDVGEKERWYRPGGQPWFPVFLTARALKDWYFRGESPTDELIAAFSGVSPSAGPLLQGLLAARDYYKDPTRFKFGPAFARAAKPFVPFGRISEGIRRQQGGPEVQSRTFVQELAEAAPFPIPDEWIGSRKTIIDPLTKLPVMRNPDFETLRFWTGVFLSDISLQTYRGVRGQMLERTIERLDRAEDMDTYNRAMGQLKELDFPRWRMLQDRANEKRILFSTKELNFQKYLTEKQEAARNPPPVTALPPRSPALPPLREQSAPSR